MSEYDLRAPIEAILMVISEPVTPEDLAAALGTEVADVEATLRALAHEYLGEGGARVRGFELREVAGGWRIYSARAYADVVGRFVVGSPTRGSRKPHSKRWQSLPTASRSRALGSPVSAASTSMASCAPSLPEDSWKRQVRHRPGRAYTARPGSFLRKWG